MVKKVRSIAKTIGVGRAYYQFAIRPRSVLTNAFKRVSSFIRVLPDFLVIGVHKGGTSALYGHICSHPHVVRASFKEVHFFDCENYDRGTDWYRSHFVMKGQVATHHSRYGRQLLTGEASPFYLFHPLVPVRAFKVLPKAKLIVVLRDPVDRAYSHFEMSCRRGEESLTFEEAIAEEPLRLKPYIDILSNNPHDTSVGFRSGYSKFSYLSRGLYANQVKRWLKFYERENILFLRSELLLEQPNAVMQQVFCFLGLPKFEFDFSEKKNVGNYFSSMDSSTRAYLYDYFKPYNTELSELLKENYTWL